MSHVTHDSDGLYVNVCDVCGQRGPATHHEALAAQNASIHDTDFPHRPEALFDFDELAEVAG